MASKPRQLLAWDLSATPLTVTVGAYGGGCAQTDYWPPALRLSEAGLIGRAPSTSANSQRGRLAILHRPRNVSHAVRLDFIPNFTEARDGAIFATDVDGRRLTFGVQAGSRVVLVALKKDHLFSPSGRRRVLPK
jgi:hypothetical protein